MLETIQFDTEKPLTESEEQQLIALASESHDRWRKTRLQDDGSFEPRLKSTNDSVWAEAHGVDQVDIANTSFENLPSDLQAENLAAARVAILTREVVGQLIHDAWLDRHPEAKDGPLGVPFDQLTGEEQAKDLDQEELALKL